VVSFGGLRALDKVTVSVEPGTIVGLIGPNGSGKTTLLDTVSGIVAPTEGSLRFDGEDLADYLPEERAALGLVRSFQDCRLYPELTVHDTLMLCEDARQSVRVLSTTLQLPWARRTEHDKRKAVDRAIASFGLDRFRHHLTGHLSTGTRRVVDLASIVLAGPRLLLLDEPTAGIAQREAEAFIPLLRQLQEVTGSTILLVEHDVPLVFELCSTVIVMQTGSVVISGSPDVVREDPRALAAYLGASDAALNVTGPARPDSGSGTGSGAGTGPAGAV
jgi:ABC-type branched-subunit amino acid transport system ATPase component